MKAISTVLCILSILFANAQIGKGTKDSHTFLHSGVTRQYNVYKPSSYTGNKDFPLVLVLHPGIVQEGDTMNVQMERYTHFDLVADTADFLIAYPNSRKDNDGWAHWDHTNSKGWNDVSFLNQMMDSIVKNYSIDTCKIYMTGFSTGGFMSYSMACESGHRLAGIAPVSGQKNTSYNCNPYNQVPVFHIHGDADDDAKYFGDQEQDLDSVATILRIWYKYNNCNTNPEYTKYQIQIVKMVLMWVNTIIFLIMGTMRSSTIGILEEVTPGPVLLQITHQKWEPDVWILMLQLKYGSFSDSILIAIIQLGYLIM